MRSAILTTTTALLSLLPSALSQTAPATTASAATAAGTGSAASAPRPTASNSAADVDAIVSFLIPSLTSTSLSPAQSSAILRDASSYLSSFTSASPLESLKTELFIAGFGASTTPTDEQLDRLTTVLDQASTGLVNDPSAYIASVDSIISPFGFASKVHSYESEFTAGLATVVASELSVSAPAQTASGSAAVSTGAAPVVRGGAGVALGVAAGVVGAGLF